MPKPGQTRPGIDIAEWMAWQERCGKYAKVFWDGIGYARNQMLPRLSVYDQTAARAVRDLIELLIEVRQPLLLRCVRLRSDDPFERLFNHQRQSIQVGMWATAELAVYDPDEKALQEFARRAIGAGSHWTYTMHGQTIQIEKWPVLAWRNGKTHWKDWRTADDPQAWAGRVARTMALK